MADGNRYRGWSPVEERKLTELLARNVPRGEIAARLNRSPGAIAARISRLGVAADGRRRFSAAEDRVIREARSAGTTYAAIARRLGRSEGAVKCRARWLGLASRRQAGNGVGKPSPRRCLMHGGRFQPAHRHEFVCPACKDGEEWQAGNWMG